ncbi:MAG TPA: ABC transporter ATP-binding protein [Symbiobacteriaceae bacterium]|jgi:branched-chain amino acid transport system ATP-binding protein
MTLLRLEAVHTYIGQFHILQGIDMEIEEGGVTVLLGRNGAGKTTTLKTIIGLLAPRSGQILVKGAPIGGKPAYEVARHGIGYVPEDRGVFTDLTVEENLRLAERKRGQLEARKQWILDVFPDLGRFWAQKGGRLSGGQQQMLAIGRALVADNAILLIDEPSKGLAPIVVEHLAQVLNQLKAHTTIVLVEQNFWLAAATGDRYCILDDGLSVHAGQMAALIADSDLQARHLGVSAKGRAV